MLDLHHPHTPFIFAAEGHLLEIKLACQSMTIASPDQRCYIAQTVRSHFVALR